MTTIAAAYRQLDMRLAENARLWRELDAARHERDNANARAGADRMSP